MRQIWRGLIGTIIVVLLVTAGAVGRGLFEEQAKAKGMWRVVIGELACVNFDCQGSGSSMSLGEMKGEAGNPDGDTRYLTNAIARLEQDGCEWQVLSIDVETTDWVMLYRC